MNEEPSKSFSQRGPKQINPALMCHWVAVLELKLSTWCDSEIIFFPWFLCIGVPGLITADMVKEGAAVIDVGINRMQDPKTGKMRLIGDVDFEGK